MLGALEIWDTFGGGSTSSPRSWPAKHTIRFLESIGELAGHQNTLANLPEKRTMFDTARAGMLVSCDHRSRELIGINRHALLPNHPEGDSGSPSLLYDDY